MTKIAEWTRFSVKNRQGLKLSALLCSADRKTFLNYVKSNRKKIVIVCHGFTGSKEGGGRALEMAELISRSGFSTLLFDFSGSGQSEGAWEDITLSGQCEDLGSVVEWCRRNDYHKIILTGRSFGGSTAIEYAAGDPGIDAVCTWAAVARPAKLFEKLAEGPIEGPEDELVSIKGGDERETVFLKRLFFQDLLRHDLLKSVSSLAPASFLAIHGSADESVAVKEAYLLYEAAGEPRDIEIIDGADHRFSCHIEQVWKIFLHWLVSLG
jgi:uncharacterized protein